jgi:hypothetical protein
MRTRGSFLTVACREPLPFAARAIAITRAASASPSARAGAWFAEP